MTASEGYYDLTLSEQFGEVMRDLESRHRPTLMDQVKVVDTLGWQIDCSERALVASEPGRPFNESRAWERLCAHRTMELLTILAKHEDELRSMIRRWQRNADREVRG